MNTEDKLRVWDIHMVHFHNDLGHCDATVDRHYVPRRLFKISEDLNYPCVEHPVLLGDFKEVGKCEVTIFHLAHINHCFNIKKRYDKNIKHSNIHNKQFLDGWLKAHVLGSYPTKPTNPMDIPEVILRNFGIDKDELYFTDRNIEGKHFIDAHHWKTFFNCISAIEWGCGRGPRVLAMRVVGINAVGIELSDWAVEHSFSPVIQGNILENPNEFKADLSIAYDVLEHIDYKDLDKAINTLINSTNKNILVSVPVKGDPNLLNDNTHKIFETKEWWLNQFILKGLKHIETPNHFLFKDQVLIFEKEKI